MDIVVKFIDRPDEVVEDAIAGLCLGNPRVQRIANTNVVVSAEVDASKVLLICGGGSGHEPAHVGFVADGWLSAAVCGSVFASPPTAHVSAAIEYLARLQGPQGPGILVIVKNYAGDRLNFEFAVRQAREHGILVDSVLVADDAVFGVEDVDQRRGIAGCCLLYKMLGVAAARGHSLGAIRQLADRVSSNMRSVGASLSSCALPGCPQSSVVPHGMVELGLGIHGEQGLVRRPFPGARALALEMVNTLLGSSSVTGAGRDAARPAEPTGRAGPPPEGSKLVLLVNNLGSTTELEMSIMAAHALRALMSVGYTVVGMHTGRHMTSLDMHGLSFTLLTLVEEEDVAYVLHTVDAQKGLMNFHAPSLEMRELPGPMTALELAKQASTPASATAGSPLRAALHRVFTALTEAESLFNALDAEVGDGDLGSGVRRASQAALELLPFLPCEADLRRTGVLLAKAVADACGGTSGPLYGALLVGGGRGAHRVFTASGAADAVGAVRAAIAEGSAEVQRLGGAAKGDRTMVDVLEALRESPAVHAATTISELLATCRSVAHQAAKDTAQLPAKRGRSRYMNGKEIGKPDPGAELVAAWLDALAE